jgi:hypothetical protein
MAHHPCDYCGAETSAKPFFTSRLKISLFACGDIEYIKNGYSKERLWDYGFKRGSYK